MCVYCGGAQSRTIAAAQINQFQLISYKVVVSVSDWTELDVELKPTFPNQPNQHVVVVTP